MDSRDPHQHERSFKQQTAYQNPLEQGSLLGRQGLIATAHVHTLLSQERPTMGQQYTQSTEAPRRCRSTKNCSSRFPRASKFHTFSLKKSDHHFHFMSMSLFGIHVSATMMGPRHGNDVGVPGLRICACTSTMYKYEL